MNEPGPQAEFDEFAKDYDAALAEGIGISGENKEYFVRQRIAWLADWLNRIGFQPQSVMDFGCGTGSAVPDLLRLPGVSQVLGVDVSQELLGVARRRHETERVRFTTVAEHAASSDIDLVFCNGVFHHIAPSDRPAALEHIRNSLRPGGWFALWENNPWNPGTRYVMSRIKFDREAVMLRAAQTRRLLANAGFEIISTNYLFIFPRFLSWLRWIEPLVCRLPLGAQYQVLARKPA